MVHGEEQNVLAGLDPQELRAEHEVAPEIERRMRFVANALGEGGLSLVAVEVGDVVAPEEGARGGGDLESW
jgi:hypothetical protein